MFEVSLADLQNESDAERSFRKFRLIAEEVQGKNVLCNFHGFNLTTDKLRSMVKKWQVRESELCVVWGVRLSLCFLSFSFSRVVVGILFLKGTSECEY